MIEIYKKTLKDSRLKRIKEIEIGSWISITNPTKKEMGILEKTFKIDFTILEDALDENEISRIEKDGHNFYMIMRFPT